MPSQLENTLNQAVAKIVGAIDDFSTLTITTKFVIVEEGQAADTGNEGQKPALPSTVTSIEVDGDYNDTIPLHRLKTGEGAEEKLKVNTELHSLHMQNVARAIEYRQGFIDTIMNAAKSIVGG